MGGLTLSQQRLDDAVQRLAERSAGRVVVLTGAGISAESGIPTFRGPEGYWTVGSKDYHPQEMATQAAFSSMPREVWRWYLHRLGVCRAAAPNAAHHALATLEARLGGRFALITQNVDGLHLRAGNTAARTMEIHGNIDFMRPAHTKTLHPVPNGLAPRDRDTPITDDEWRQLHLHGALARPHVLWFDEYYDQELYRSATAMAHASSADVFITVGTSGATSLPLHAAAAATQNGALLLDVNPQDNPFRRAAAMWVDTPAAQAIGRLAAALS